MHPLDSGADGNFGEDRMKKRLQAIFTAALMIAVCSALAAADTPLTELVKKVQAKWTELGLD